MRGTLRELQRQQGETLRELERLRLEQLQLRMQQQAAILRLLESERLLLAHAAPGDEAASDAVWLDRNGAARAAVLELLSHAASAPHSDAASLSVRWDALEPTTQRAALAHAAQLLEASLSRLGVQFAALNAGRPSEAERVLPAALVETSANPSPASASDSADSQPPRRLRHRHCRRPSRCRRCRRDCRCRCRWCCHVGHSSDSLAAAQAPGLLLLLLLWLSSCSPSGHLSCRRHAQMSCP